MIPSIYRYVQVALLLTVGASHMWISELEAQEAPATRVDNVREVLHSTEVIDPYRWLEDQESPEVRAWIDAQNAFSEPLLASIPGRDQRKQRLTELMKIDDIRTPWERSGRYFFSKRLASQDLFVLYMRRELKGADEVLIDPHPLSPDHTTTVSLLDVSKDGTLVVYGVRHGGEDEMVIKFLDADSRKELADVLPRARYFDFALKPDKTGIFYSLLGPEGPRVYYHATGTPPPSDQEIFGKGYSRESWIDLNLSENGNHLLIVVGSGWSRTDLYYRDLARPGTAVVSIVNDVAANFFGKLAGDQLFILTNWQAPKGRIVQVDLKNPARDRWRQIIPESVSAIQDFFPVGGKLFVNYLENVSSTVKIFHPEGRYASDISFPGIGTVRGITGQWSSSEAFFSFDSFQMPTTIFRYDIGKGSREVWARLNVPVQSDLIEVNQVWYESKDKTRIPMFLVHKRGLRLDGSSPTYLTGYGGFNSSQTPYFSQRAVLWAERGGVYAIPSLRGGAEFGEEWHQAGMLFKKQNTFDDFIAAAEWLIANKYTSPENLAIAGGSNGGLLVGAAITQRPELFRAAICSYPLLDMVRYHNFLVARFWVPEYGSSENAEQFKYLLAYSPYHNVKPGAKYPAVLFLTGDADTRVAPLHARKMAALLQAATGSNHPILLKYEIKAGHSGGKPLTEIIEDTADEIGFVWSHLNPAARQSDR
jgi:prolyl oligopeptidase